MLRLFNGDGVGADAPASSAAMIAAGGSIRRGCGSRPSHGDRGQAGNGKLEAAGRVDDAGRFNISGRFAKIAGGEHMHHGEGIAAVCSRWIGQGDGQAVCGEVSGSRLRPGSAAIGADLQLHIIDGGVGLGNAGIGLCNSGFHGGFQLFGSVQRLNVLQSGRDLGNAVLHDQLEFCAAIISGRIRQDHHFLCLHGAGCICPVVAIVSCVGGREDIVCGAVGQGRNGKSVLCSSAGRYAKALRRRRGLPLPQLH